MSLSKLLEQDLTGYISENRDANNLWFFVHIPKTAGSSFRRELAQSLQPNYNIHVDDDHRTISYDIKLQSSFDTFLVAAAGTRFRFVSGHVPMTLATKVQQACENVRFLTVLRDPVQRVISDFRYQRTPKHPGMREFIERYRTFTDYINDPFQRDKMCLFLTPHEGADPVEIERYVMKTFSFVGTLEMYPLSLRLMLRLLSAERAPSVYERRTEERSENALDVTPELVAEIRRLNAKDVAVHHALTKPLKAIREAVFPQRRSP